MVPTADLALRAPSPLAALDQARALLDASSDVADVKAVRDKAEALRIYARQATAGLEVQNRCAELKLRAERKAGELLAASDVGRGRKSVTLTDFGVSSSQSSRWQRIAGLPDAEFDAYIAEAFRAERELTSTGALKLARQHAATDPATRPPLHVVGDVAHGQHGLPGLTGAFTTIVADPPWRYGNTATRGAAEDHYPTMTVEELCDLSVEAHAADAAHLYLWTTNGFLREAFEVVEAWGFTYKTCLTWVKPQMGMGNYFRGVTEHVLFGVRGSLRTARRDLTNVIAADRRRHSAKPESFYDIVEAASPGPYLEMFARRRRLGDWTTWGNES